MAAAGDDNSILALVDELLGALHTADQGMKPGKELHAWVYAVAQVGNAVQLLWQLRPSVPNSPTNALMQLANALIGLADGATDDPRLKPAERTKKPPPPMDVQHGRAFAAAMMEFLIRTRSLKREAAARLVVQVMGDTTLLAGLDGEPWRIVDRWRAAHTGNGPTASKDMVEYYQLALGVLLREVPPDADAARLKDVFRQWRAKNGM
jgi:hypothetical protein